jgi:hypothetical protein
MYDILTKLCMKLIGFPPLKVSLVKVVFAADLAEMLSSDMQKEGLLGRTLTLKLKTASFEVLLDPPLRFLL